MVEDEGSGESGNGNGNGNGNGDEDGDGDEDVVLLSEDEIGALLDDAELCGMLRDPRLQTLIRAIDGGEDRERALDNARERDPDFLGFTDRVLDLFQSQRQRPT